MAKAFSRICFFMIYGLEARRPPCYSPVGRFADQKEKSMTRADAIAQARQQLHSGEFLAELDRRVAYRTESQNPERPEALRGYLEEELHPAFAKLDFSTRLIESPTGKSPYLLAEYRENSSAPTVLMYGHGDVVGGMAGGGGGGAVSV